MTVPPTQSGLLVVMVITGSGFTSTVVLPVAVQPELSVTVTV